MGVKYLWSGLRYLGSGMGVEKIAPSLLMGLSLLMASGEWMCCCWIELEQVYDCGGAEDIERNSSNSAVEAPHVLLIPQIMSHSPCSTEAELQEC